MTDQQISTLVNVLRYSKQITSLQKCKAAQYTGRDFRNAV